MAVPYTFGSATTSIPLSQLDSNFATTITLGNTAIQLGNTVTTLNNMTLANVTISSGTSNLAATAITNGTSNVTIASSGGNISMATNGTTAITVDTSQNVGIGTASPVSKLNVNGGSVTLAETTTGAYNIDFQSRTASTNARIQYDQLSNTTGQLLFYTNGGSLAERMRIDSSGNLLVGTTTYATTPTQGMTVANTTSASVNIGHTTGTPSGYLYVNFGYNAGQIGSITQNGTTGVLYNLTSDYRLKNNPVALTGAKNFVMALQPKKWQWWDGSGEGVGFIAHEFMEVAKYSGNGTKDAVETIEIKDEQGNVTGTEQRPIMQSIQPSSSEVMANIVALMQEQQTLIDTQAETINALTARIVALEAK